MTSFRVLAVAAMLTAAGAFTAAVIVLNDLIDAMEEL